MAASLLNGCFQSSPMGHQEIKNRKFIQELFNRRPLSKEIKLSTVKEQRNKKMFQKRRTEEEVVEKGGV